MKKNVCVLLLVSGLQIALSGCQGGQNNSEAGAPPKSVTEKDAPILVVDEVYKPHAADVKSQVNKAIQDLANRLDVLSDEIKVIRAENVTWRDGSLGCPQKGMMYTQALISGTLVVLGSGGVEYEYHSGSGRDPLYCAIPQTPAPGRSAE
jgi:hypothetical protein